MVVVMTAFILISCTKKSEVELESTKKTVPELGYSAQQDLSQSHLRDQSFSANIEFLDHLRFAGSVETEIFKIVDPRFKSTDKIPSQLRILSELLDLKYLGKTGKKFEPVFYNCHKISVEAKPDQELEVSRACEKKASVIARIKKIGTNEFKINFLQSEWQTVIGDSAMLNQKDKICKIIISDKKVFEVICDNTIITVGSGAQLEEIKLHHFKFDRTDKNQIVITGGRFKDFIERSKIDITVPEDGKIKFKEEELSVKDDYEPLPVRVAPPQKDFIPPSPQYINEPNPNPGR